MENIDFYFKDFDLSFKDIDLSFKDIDLSFKDNDPLHLCIDVEDVVVDKADDSVTYSFIPIKSRGSKNYILKNFYKYIDSLNR